MILVNGEADGVLSARDRGLAYGDGLFTTIAVRCRQPQLLDLHWRRLATGCERLGIPMPATALLLDDMRRLLDAASPARQAASVIKIIITRGVDGRGYRACGDSNASRVVMLFDWPVGNDEKAATGVSCRVCKTRLASQPLLAGIKHLNRLEQVIASAEWRDERIADGIMLDERGYIIEGIMSNIFFVDAHQTLITPSLEYCGVAGVQRENIMRIANNVGVHVKTAQVPLARLDEFAEVFLSNSVIGVWPVTAVDERQFSIGPVTRTLQRELSDDHEAR